MRESGLVVVDKPGGITSHDVVSRVRRIAGTRKVGHAGTLDPMATGVLLLGVNRATRLLGHLMLTDKAYHATIRLGISTVTDDAESEITSVAPIAGVDEDDVRRAIGAFVGDIEQVPSAVSAIKVDGRRSYARVRAGEEVALEPRAVTVHELTVVGVRPEQVAAGAAAAADVLDVDVRVRCSSGTYIRAIARDLGRALGVGGHLTRLRRTEVGPYHLGSAQPLDDLASEFSMMPIAEAARAAFTSVDLDGTHAADVRFGRSIELEIGGLSALFAPDGEFLALYEPADGRARPVAVFV